MHEEQLKEKKYKPLCKLHASVVIFTQKSWRSSEIIDELIVN